MEPSEQNHSSPHIYYFSAWLFLPELHEVELISHLVFLFFKKLTPGYKAYKNSEYDTEISLRI